MTGLSDKKKLEIESQAKEILKKFGTKLESVRINIVKSKKEVGGFRREGGANKVDSGFREAFLSNAPKKKGDFIYAEKKSW